MCKCSNALSKPALIGRAASLTFITIAPFNATESGLKVRLPVMRFRDLVCELEIILARDCSYSLCLESIVKSALCRLSVKSFPGGDGGGVTPVPISNTEVKPSSADGTALETRWESRKLPGFF